MQVLPVSNVANFQLWAVGARGRAEAARVPLPRGAARWCARASSPALFCGEWEGLSTAAKMAAPHTAATGRNAREARGAPIAAALLVAAGGLTNGGMIWYPPRRTLTGIAFAISGKKKIMRIITDEYREQLLKNRVYQMIVNTPKPDFTQLDKEVAEFEEWIAQEHKKEREARLAHGASAR